MNTAPRSEPGFTGRALAAVERIGNRLPDPTVLFIALLFAVWLLSWMLSYVDWGVSDPRSGAAIDGGKPALG